jgi:hypothetical protein
VELHLADGPEGGDVPVDGLAEEVLVGRRVEEDQAGDRGGDQDEDDGGNA